MKKLKFFILFSLFFALVFSKNINTTFAYAETTRTIYISSSASGDDQITGEISVDTTFENINFIVDSALDTAFNITSGKLTLKNCTISAQTANDSITQIFNVSSSGELVLDTVLFANFENYNYAILNKGKIKITNTNFLAGKFSISNESTLNDSIIYESGELRKVQLKSGYITITEDTYIPTSSTIKVQLDGDQDSSVNGLVVKGSGQNVFASKYINNFSYYLGKDNWYFDYVGDFDEALELKDSFENPLNPGDIVVTKQTIEFRTGDNYKDPRILHSAQYCTSSLYVKNQNNTLYSNDEGKTFDNFTANTYTSTPKYANPLNEGSFLTTLTINSKSVGSDTTHSTSTISYLTGANWAIFADIPESHTLDSITITDNDTSTTTNVFTIDENELFANSKYLRPIVRFNSDSTIKTYNITIDFNFKSSVQYVENITEDLPTGIELEYADSMIVGEEYDFTIPVSDDYIVTNILFNGNEITFNQGDTHYTFTATVEQSNTIKVIIVEFPLTITITPNPTQTTFEYGEDIVLQQIYTVPETNETITITFTPEETPTTIGTHYYTKAISSSDKYIIVLTEGTYSYTINRKQISLSSLGKNSVTETYYPGILDELEVNDFISNIPNYLNARLDTKNTNLSVGSNTLTINFEVNDPNYEINGQTNLDVELIINKNTNNDYASDATMSGVNVIYTGEAVQISAENYNENAVDIVYTYYLVSGGTKTPVSEMKNAGEYEVVATLTAKNPELCEASKELRATVIINKVVIDMSNYISLVANYAFTYDKTAKEIDLKEEILPAHVSISTVVRNDGSSEPIVNFGTHTFTINFEYDNNYTGPESTTSTLTINKRVLGITLKQTSFDYTGNTQKIELNLSNVITDDNVAVILNNADQTDAGTYYLSIAEIKNPNYTIESNLNLSYTINPIVFTDFTFDDITVTYDGQSHLPVFEGELPSGIEKTIQNIVCKNVKTTPYEVECTFSGTNKNYLAPAKVKASVTILPRPIEVIFEEPASLMASGLELNINVRFTNVVEGETVSFTKTYSAPPINAGSYTCFVELSSKSNYTITNAKRFDFKILSDSVRFYDNKISILMESKFASEDALVVTHTTEDLKIVSIMQNMKVKNYKSINLTYSAYTSDPVKVTIPSKDIVTNAEYLKIYKYQNGELVELEYTIENNLVSFSLNSSGDLIFVEEYSQLYKNRFLIIGLSALGILCLGGGITTTVIICKKKKKSKLAK